LLGEFKNGQLQMKDVGKKIKSEKGIQTSNILGKKTWSTDNHINMNTKFSY